MIVNYIFESLGSTTDGHGTGTTRREAGMPTDEGKEMERRRENRDCIVINILIYI